jgi:lipid II:glycine glycyltransferase (peptidoglycan interpeptide bridge formation enzyme)
MQHFHHSFTDWLPFYWEGFSQTTRYTYILEDISDPDRLWEGMSSNIRRNINRARFRNEISVRAGVSAEDLSRMLALTFERQHLKPKHLHVLEALVEESRRLGRGDVWGGYDAEGILHAAAFVVWQQRTAYYIAGGSDPARRESGAHSLTLWEAIRSVAAHSKSFDFEGSMLPGVERFFREFGAVQRPYFCISRGRLSIADKIRIRLSRNE